MEMISITYANTFVSLLTNGMVSVAINDTSYLLLGLVKNVIVEHPDIKKTTDKIDLYSKLMVIDNFMKIIPTDLEKNKCISTSLQSIHDIILQIQNELELINNIIETHSEKYFYYFRKHDYYIQLENIVNYKKILDERFDILLKLITTLNILK
jgi:hypothetical protein|tara:strand:+ start:745 stop:1203 length:459 start_codon:yes stop_codon:yes gene_type:complete